MLHLGCRGRRFESCFPYTKLFRGVIGQHTGFWSLCSRFESLRDNMIAKMMDLVDVLVSNTSGVKSVRVQVPLFAHNKVNV